MWAHVSGGRYVSGVTQPSEDRAPLRGVARSLDVLFGRIRGEEAGHRAAAPDALARAARALASGHGDPEPLARRIREEAATLFAERSLEPLADAAELLARSAPPSGPSPARDLARELTTPAVSAVLALRLAAARDEARLAELNETFRRLGEEAARALGGALAVAEDRADRENLVGGLVAMGEVGLDEAERMVKEGNDWGVVRNGVVVLGELGGERAITHLMDTLRHHKPQVRRETVHALGRIGGENAVLLLMSRINDDDEGVRAAVARALGSLGSARVVKTLLARLEEEDSEEVAQEILRALGELGDPGAVPAIEKRAVRSFFSRPSPALRLEAYRALALIGTPHARSLIEQATEDRDPDVRALARSFSERG